MPHPDKATFGDLSRGDVSAELPVNGHPVPEIDVTPRPILSTFLISGLPK